MLKKFLIVGLAALCFCPSHPASAKVKSSPPPFIVVDQFGYLPDAQKIAVIRDPVIGFDSQWHFSPGKVYQVVDVETSDGRF